MERREALLAARGITDERDRLLSADDPLAELQQNCGGTVPGMLAVPELLDLVQQGRSMGLRIAREFSAFDGAEIVSGFVRIRPLDESAGGGCELLVENWHRSPAEQGSRREVAERLDAIDRAAAEITARLDATQQVQLLSAEAVDATELQKSFSEAPGKVWTEYVNLLGVSHQQPLHWRLLDGAHCEVPGSERSWRVRLLPIGPTTAPPRGFELLLVADEPAVDVVAQGAEEGTSHTRLVGSALTPVLRKPIARVIANAETIRAKLAGPLRAEYSDYAGNIAAAGQHLSGMLDDLADLEVVEAPDFKTIREKVNIGDVARRAAGILGVRAQARSITLDLPDDKDGTIARAEFRRVLQILINLIGNAIAYSPEGSTVTVTTTKVKGGKVSVLVSDEGAGVSEEQAAKIFDKFERLGRDSDGGNDTGSGLGLYISRRLAEAMDGSLTLESGKGHGATFTLTLPAHTTKG